MKSIFKTWRKSRELFLTYFDNYTIDQLNKITEGFNNNLIWNIGHVIVSQQALIYKGSGLPMYISTDLVELYMPGSKPTQKTTQTEVDELKGLLASLIGKTEGDFEKGIFNSYQERVTGTGFHLNSLEDAIQFMLYHEGIHLGCMMNIRKFV